VRLEAGDHVTFAGGPMEVVLLRNGAASPPMAIAPAASGGRRLEAVAGPLELVLAPAPGAEVEACFPTDRTRSGYGVIDLVYDGDGPRLVLVGDSISALSEDELRAALADRSVRMAAIQGEGLAGGGLTTAGGLGSMGAWAADVAADEPEVVVVALGTNDALLGELALPDALAAWDRIAEAHEAACLVGVSFPAGGEGVDAAEARALDDRMRARSDVVVPWAEAAAADPGRYLEADGIHPTTAGQELFASLVADAAGACDP
jgi:lysophospholipase L1-like esterase